MIDINTLSDLKTENDVVDFLKYAAAGKTVVYHRGFLGCERRYPEYAAANICADLLLRASGMRALFEDGNGVLSGWEFNPKLQKVSLFQQRVGDRKYVYLARKCEGVA